MSIRILHLEDSALDAEIIQDKLEASGLACDIVRLDGKAQFINALAGEAFDVVLCDDNLPDYDGLSALKLVRETHPETPVIIISGTLGEEKAVHCLQLGATDYVLKHQLERLPSAVKRALQEAEEQRKHHQVAMKLRESEERFRQITENVADLIALLDLEGRRVYNNPAFQRHLLGDPSLQIGSDSFQEVHPDDRERIHRIFTETVRTGVGQCAEYRFVGHDGTVRYIESRGSVVRNASGRITNVLVVGRDVTERKRTEEALRKSHEDYRRVIEDIFKFVPEALLVFARNLNLYKDNKAFEDLVRTYAPKLLYTEPELRELLLQEIRAKVLNGGAGEIRIPPKNRDGQGARAPDHSGESAEPAAPPIPGFS